MGKASVLLVEIGLQELLYKAGSEAGTQCRQAGQCGRQAVEGRLLPEAWSAFE